MSKQIVRHPQLTNKRQHVENEKARRDAPNENAEYYQPQSSKIRSWEHRMTGHIDSCIERYCQHAKIDFEVNILEKMPKKICLKSRF